MSKKIIGIFLISMLVFPSIIVSAEQIDANKSSTISSDNVPIWGIGDSWTYTINNFWVNTTFEGKTIKMSGTMDDLKWTVSDITETTYVVRITGTVSASYMVKIVLDNLILKFNGVIDSSLNKLIGTVIFNKANLHIVDFDASLFCLSSVRINQLPIDIPMPMRISANGALSVPFPLFDFPLHVLKFWNLPEIDIVTDLKIGGIFGLFHIPMTIIKHYDWAPLAFSCLYKTTIEVDAGTFDAWRILSLIGGYFDYYYAPSVENLVKFEFNLPNGGVDGELKSFEQSTLNIKEKNSL